MLQDISAKNGPARADGAGPGLCPRPLLHQSAAGLQLVQVSRSTPLLERRRDPRPQLRRRMGPKLTAMTPAE